MSDGDRESEQENLAKSENCKLPGCDEFSRAVARVAVAQICDSAGFHSSQLSALDALSEVAIRYISDLGKSASFYAGLAGRSSCSAFDIIRGLEDLSPAHGAADPQSCLVDSGVVRYIIQFVSTGEEVPFAKPIPRFPITNMPKPVPSFAKGKEVPIGKHIPDWLPRCPDPHTYLHTPVWSERSTDSKGDKVEQAKQRRRAERSLLSLQQRLALNSSAGFEPVKNANVGKNKQVVGGNAFLSPPLPQGNKAVPRIVVPSGNADRRRVTVIETFAPAIEAAKSGSFDFSVDKGSLPKNRPVQFRIGVNKKSVVAPMFPKSVNSKKEVWSLRDDERDEKKRRAEMILKEAIEKPHDLAQL